MYLGHNTSMTLWQFTIGGVIAIATINVLMISLQTHNNIILIIPCICIIITLSTVITDGPSEIITCTAVHNL